MIIRFLHVLNYSRSGLTIKIAGLLVLLSFIIGTLGYSIIEDVSIFEGFYFHVITFSTVGYSEMPRLSSMGKAFTSFMIIMNIAIFAYSVSAFTQLAAEGKLFKKIFDLRMNASIQKLQDHVIICGFGRYGKQCMEHFSYRNIPYVIVERSEEAIASNIEEDKNFRYVIGDATEDETLEKSGIHKAKAVIAALPDDTENLYTVLSARQLNPDLTIISRANFARSEKKLALAGADHVLMPERIGGFYMATMLDQPGTIEFFSYLSREAETDVDFEEIEFHELKDEYQGRSIRDLAIRERCGANVLGSRTHEGRVSVNPEPSVRFEKDIVFIVLGTKEQIKSLKKIYYRPEYQDIK